MKSHITWAAVFICHFGLMASALPTGDDQTARRSLACTIAQSCAPFCSSAINILGCDQSDPPATEDCSTDDDCSSHQCPPADTPGGKPGLPYCADGKCGCRDPDAPVEYHKVELSQSEISFGTAVNPDGGNDIAKKLKDGMVSHCPEDKDECDPSAFDVSEIFVVYNDGREPVILEAYVDTSRYSSVDSRNWMIAALITGAVEATRSSCALASYWEDYTGAYECPNSDRTGLARRDDDTLLQARINGGEVIPHTSANRRCRYNTNMCTGPKVLYTTKGIEGDPYQDTMQIRFELKQIPNNFSPLAEWACETFLGAASDLAFGKLPGYSSDVLGLGGVPDTLVDVTCGSGGVDPGDIEGVPT